jgi:hypothetical protein
MFVHIYLKYTTSLYRRLFITVFTEECSLQCLLQAHSSKEHMSQTLNFMSRQSIVSVRPLTLYKESTVFVTDP